MTKLTFTFALFVFSLSFAALHAQNLKMYVSDAGNFNLPPWKIFKFDDDGSNGEVFISDHLAWPQDIFFLDEENSVLISNLNTGEILRFDATSGDYKDVFASGLGGPTRMKQGSDSLLYVLQWSGDGKVKRYTLNGDFVDNFTTVGVPKSIGLDWDKSGNLFISSYDGFIRKFSPTGEDMGVFISSNLAGPTNIWFDQGGNLFALDYNGALVNKFDSSGVFKENFITSVPQCEGVDFLPNGNILIGVGGTSSVRLYNPQGDLVKTVVPSGELGLLRPNAVVLHEEFTTNTTDVTPSYRELDIVKPSIGTYFQVALSNDFVKGANLDFNNSAGRIVMRINLADTISIDASALPDGVYILTLPLNGNTLARQKIVIQH